MPSQIKVDQIAGATGSTVTLPSGQTLDLSSGTVTLPSAGITADKLNLISTASVPSITAKGTPSVSDGYIQLNCEQNSHGIKIKSPPHSAAASYTMVMPNAIGTSNQVLKMNSGATALEFGTVSAGTYSVHAISRYNYQTATSTASSTNYIDIAGGNFVSFTPTSTNDIIYLSHYCSMTQPTSATGADTYLMMGTSSSITSGDTRLNYDGQNLFYIAAQDMYHFISKSFLLPCTSLTPSTTYYIEQAGALHNSNSVTWNYTSASGSGDFKNHNVSLIHYKFN